MTGKMLVQRRKRGNCGEFLPPYLLLGLKGLLLL
jgi:hypothetical protein